MLRGAALFLTAALSRFLKTWKFHDGLRNAKTHHRPLDESHHRLFNTSRNPPLLIVHDTETGKQITQLESVQGIDDVWYDAKLKRIYATGGRGPGGEAFVDGFVAVYQQKDADHYELITKIPTRTGTCTSIWVPQLNRLYASAPGTEKQEAAILVFEPQS